MNAADANLVTYDEEPDRYVLATPTDSMNDPAVHIRELTAWLTAHPKQRGTQQYTDRETSLARWQDKVRLIARTKTLYTLGDDDNFVRQDFVLPEA